MRNKRAAQETVVANFAEGRGAAMVGEAKHAEIAGALDGIFRSTNILSPFEVKAVKKAFAKADEASTKVLGTTYAFVANPGHATFKAMAEAVSQLPADGGKVNTWPIAARMAFDLKYDSTPNWETYDATLRMAAQLLARLAPLGAKDMIDVQQFMVVTKDLN
jgi:hypothetical protein